jgi:nitrogen fixation/metabolism regulation signal transduction histidine kinase
MSEVNRKKSYVDPQVQGALVRRLVIHWVSYVSVAAAVAFCLQVLSNPVQPLGKHIQEAWWTHGLFLLVLVFLLPVFVLDSIKLSNRFAGPIYRLRRTIHNIAQGDPPPRLKFRDFDFWQGMAQDFNLMIDRLSGRDIQHEEEDSVETPEPAEIR